MLNQFTLNIRWFRVWCFLFLFFSWSGHAEENRAGETDPPPFQEPTADLTLATAMGLALEHSPQLAVFDWGIRAAEARGLQAKLLPNPEISFEVEDIGLNSGNGTTTRTQTIRPGNGWSIEQSIESPSLSGVEEALYTVRLSQLVELGGKRTQRVAEAHEQLNVARWDYEVARVEVLALVGERFIDVLEAQERVHLLQQVLDLAQQVENTTQNLVTAGKLSMLELKRAEIETAKARIDVEKARNSLTTARIKLAATWGATLPRFAQAQGHLTDPHSPPPLETISMRLANHPILKRWAAELNHRETIVSVEQSKRHPDIRVEAGLRTQKQGNQESSTTALASDGVSFSRSHDTATSSNANQLVLGLSIPLPFFDRNQGAILEAKQRVAQAQASKHAAVLETESELAALHALLTDSYHEIRAVEEQVIPKSMEAFTGIQEGYRQGKFGFIEVLDAQKVLYEGRQKRLTALATHHKTIIKMEYLLGEPLLSETVSQH